MIEVKNIRSWVYPHKNELYDLLHKAGEVQADNPDTAVVPVLVCRRAQKRTFSMGDQLGFYVLQMQRQYTRTHTPDPDYRTHLEEVRAELGFDLPPHEGPVPQMVEHFSANTRLPGRAARTAERWQLVGPACTDYFARLSSESLTPNERSELVDELARHTGDILAEEPTWRGRAG